MKNWKVLGIGILGIMVVVGAYGYRQVYSRIITTEFYLNGNSATTSPSYLATAAATTTFNHMSVQGIHQVDVYLLAQASTTATEYRWVNEFSNDSINWYGEDASVALDKNGNVSTVNGTVSVGHSTSTLVHSWVPGEVSSSTNKKITVDTSGSNFYRMRIKAYGAAGSIWGIALRSLEVE